VQIGCIGSRELPSNAVLACREMGLALARAGYTIVTGATPGVPGRDEWAEWADGAFATGAFHANPARLIVCLPWQHFPRGSPGPQEGIQAAYPDGHPEWAEAVQAYWEAAQVGPWQALLRATRLRLLRTAGIILQSRLLLAWPSEEDGESSIALDFAMWRHIPAIDLSLVPWREVLAALLAQASESAALQ
jgi:hypothetical protein